MDTKPIVRTIDPPDITLPTRLDAEVIVLPRETSEGRGLYHESVLTLVKEFKPTGVTAAFAHDRDARDWIGEKAAARLVIDLVVGIASNAGWTALCWVLRRRHTSAPVRVKLGSVRQTEAGTTWEWYEVEGKGADVADALSAIEPRREEPPELEQEKRAQATDW